MPAKKPSASKKRSNTKRNAHGSMQHAKKQSFFSSLSSITRVLLIASLFLVVIATMTYWWFFGGGMTLTEARGMESYLQSRYGKSFTVKNVHLENKYFGDATRIVGAATPIDDSEITVRVARSENNIYGDEYLNAYWNKLEKPKIDTLIKQIYGLNRLPEYSFNIEPSPDFYRSVSLQGYTPTVDEALSKYTGDIFYALNITETGSVTPETAAPHMEKVVNFLRKKTPRAYLSYTLLQSPTASLKCEIRIANIDESTAIEECFKEPRRRS